VREVSLGAYAHQDVPFEKLVEELQPERSLSHSPLFQVMFVLQNAPQEKLELSGLTLDLLDIESGTAKFDLMLSLEESEDGLDGVCEYSADLFDEATVRRMLEHFRTLLAGIVENPGERISSLPLLTSDEEQQLLYQWNETAKQFPQNLCVHELFARQSERTPDSIAVIFEDERLNYAELNERANKLAHHLRALGVGAEQVVGLMMERSVEMLVSVLAVLKAGGAYLPLDSEYPQERLAFMLEDARARVLLTQSRLVQQLPQMSARVLLLDKDWGTIELESGQDCESGATLDNPAYVIYTSGSTGRPKAVVMPHRAASNLINFQIESSGREGQWRTLQFASLSFDVSFQEIFPTLCAGGALVLLREDERKDAREWLRVIIEQRVERLFVPFVALQHLAEVAETEKLSPKSLRQVITAGEQLKITPHVARLFKSLEGCVLDNHYGPTETHLATILRLEGDADSWPKLPPIGRPIANARVYVLDDALQPVPAGVTGELYIGGEQLARGYLNRPGQTAERFIPHPFKDESAARLYKTGDLARYSADGVLEYVGRRDGQVKVRGFRVEVGEVEARLKEHPGVKQATIVAWDDDAGRKRLVAYVVAAQAASVPSIADLRLFLKDRLPDYMIPSAFIFLPALPLTTSGKVDRRALPSPSPDQSSHFGQYVAPRNGVEEIIASIWGEVLGVQRVGAHDNFFELGGHSLLATQVMTRVRAVLGVEMGLRRLFEKAELGEFAREVERAKEGEGQGTGLILGAMSRVEGAVLPLSFAQQRLWFLDKFEEGSAFYNLPSAVRINGASLDVRALERSLQEIIRRHEVLRTTFDMNEGQPVQVVSPDINFTLPLTDLSHLPETQRSIEAQRHAHEEAFTPFSLSKGPLARARLVRLSTDEHMLLLTMHHIVSDGWSIGILIRELAALYEAYSQGKESPLAELSIQYGDYAVWQRAYLQGRVLDEQLAYWRERLAGAPPLLELPTDRPRPSVKTFRGATVSATLPLSLTTELQAMSRREGVTLFMTLLAAFQTLLSRYTGQGDISTGTPIANRQHAEIESLIGFFVNTLVMRTEVSSELSFRELVKQVREVSLGAYAHQDVPFEKLVEELQPERNLSYTPLFQVAFALQNTPMPEIKLAGLQLSVLEPERETAKFDLALSLAETEQGLEGALEYNADLYDEATMKRMLDHYRTLLEAIVANPDGPIADLPLLTPAERAQLLFDWNETRRPFREELCLHELFEMQAASDPHALAVVFEDERLTYQELNRRTNKLAHHLRELRVGPLMRVGVLMERSLEMVVAVLSVLKAGGAYVPLDPSWPAERLQWIASSLKLSCLLTQHAQLRAVHDLQWKLPDLTDVICLDALTPRPQPERLDESLVKTLWNHVAEQAVDEVTAGGFISSYTGEPFAASEVGEYVARVSQLAGPYLGPEKRVLEIGCGAGLIMFELAPRAGLYVGLDPSDLTQSQNLKRMRMRGDDNIELMTGFADEIDAMFKPESFDTIVMASTAQFFPGPHYFESVLEKSLKLLAPGGTILLCDIMDARRKQEFKESLLEFQRLHPQAQTKTQLESELYFDEDYFSDLKATLHELDDVTPLSREHGFKNELGYRYDVILRKRGIREDANESIAIQPKKRLWTNWHLRDLPSGNPQTLAAPEHVAYIIFTSGSTGTPKGVMVRHRSVVNLIEWVNRTFDVGAGERLLFVTSLTFDLSVYDIFGTLAAGATIHVASRADLREPQRLASMLLHQHITFWDSAPVALQQLKGHFSNEKSPDEALTGTDLRRVFLSGDWIPLRLPEEVRAAFPRAQVVSLGGATEATVWSNYFPVGEIESHWASIPYGKPIQNARYHVLDQRLNPVPIGIPGDLFIGGECLALGYTDSALTAERFIPDPFGHEPGARLYRTGDRARYREGGDMEFLGRLDQQVKIRGYRIELGEIETALAAHQGVRESVVIVREDEPGEKRLVGYVLAGAETAPTTSELHGFLKEKLPAYMLPSSFVFLDQLPLTANGKVNRGALPAPDTSRPVLAAAYLAPTTELERRIAEIWQDVLRVEKIGVRDNFFELGGHSLLLVQVHGRIMQTLKRELSIVELFKYPTVVSLAEHLGRERQEKRDDTSHRRRGASRREAIRERLRNT
jgi:amino acid adenylation domain-containing protein